MQDEVELEDLIDAAVSAVMDVIRPANLATEVFDYDPVSIPQTPIIAVDVVGWTQEQSSLGARSAKMRYEFIFNVFYYHSEVNASLRWDEVRKRLWEIGVVLTKDIFLGGFANEGSGVRRGSTNFVKRLNGDYAVGVLDFRAVHVRQGVVRIPQ